MTLLERDILAMLLALNTVFMILILPNIVPIDYSHDPRGLFLVRLDGDRIVVQHGGPAGPSGREWEGASAEQLTQAILNEQLVGLPEHAAYLGRELQRAEVAARLGLPYRQDAPLDWGRVRAATPGG